MNLTLEGYLAAANVSGKAVGPRTCRQAGGANLTDPAESRGIVASWHACNLPAGGQVRGRRLLPRPLAGGAESANRIGMASGGGYDGGLAIMGSLPLTLREIAEAVGGSSVAMGNA